MVRDINRKQNINQFIKKWSKYHGNERGATGSFWRELLEQIYGVNDASNYMTEEKEVHGFNHEHGFIDVYIPATKVVVEQKAPDKDLSKKEKRPSFKAFGGEVTPYEQAMSYSKLLSKAETPDHIITCNFHEFWIYNVINSYNVKPVKIKLSDLADKYKLMNFLYDSKNENSDKVTQLSKSASYLITDIYDGFLEQYKKFNDVNKQSLADLNKLCVRLVFCFYADYAGLFKEVGMFRKYLINLGNASNWQRGITDLFEILNTPNDKRNPLDALNKFHYVNGGLFAGRIAIPPVTDKIKNLILDALRFDWSQISPTIFGALFESTLNPKERRQGGMHYTSIKNIHKVIDPLFLNDLKHRLNEIKQMSASQQTRQAKNFQNYLASLTFCDPGAGSGNFLTESYLCLRKLENEAIYIIHSHHGFYQGQLNLNNLDIYGNQIIKVSIHQFYGIEINDFACSVAKTALWISESQMYQKTQDILQGGKDFLPLKTNTNIHHANALRINWNSVIPANKLNYIISNPPFVGSGYRTKSQREDMKAIFKNFKNMGRNDYVTCWFKKSADMMKQNNNIKTALVATNSIIQGKQAITLWKPLMEDYGLIINFAYKPFLWHNSAKKQASVYCVIIGFSHKNSKNKVIYTNNSVIKAKNINAYLDNFYNFFITERKAPLCKVPKMNFGSMPRDKGNLSKWSEKDKQDVCKKYPRAKKLFHPLQGAQEFLHNKTRWCLWLKNVEPKDWLSIKPIHEAVQNVKEYRQNSKQNLLVNLHSIHIYSFKMLNLIQIIYYYHVLQVVKENIYQLGS